jgi:hypothetical protein
MHQYLATALGFVATDYRYPFSGKDFIWPWTATPPMPYHPWVG